MTMTIIRRILLGLAILVIIPSVAILAGIIEPDIDAPLKILALISTIVSSLFALVSGGLEISAINESRSMPEPEDPPMSSLPDLSQFQKMQEEDIMQKTIRSVEEAEDYVHHTNGRVSVAIHVDVDDSDDETEL